MGGNDLCNDTWSAVELLAALKEQDANRSALNYFIGSFIGIASPSPEMQQLFATAQCPRVFGQRRVLRAW